jgi:S1-C subfamily serine protease
MDRPRGGLRLGDMVSPERNLVSRLGILGLDLDDTLINMLGPVRAGAGVVVAAAGAASGSAMDPLRAGDIIYSVNQKPVMGVEDLRTALGAVGVGEPVVLQIERDGELRYLAFEMTEPALTLR